MKGDTSILRVTNEVSNLIMNSNMRYAQHFVNISGTSALATSFGTYLTMDRFQGVRSGSGAAGDSFGRFDAVSNGLIDSRFIFILSASRQEVSPPEPLTILQRIESIFAKRLAVEGRMSFSKLMKIAGDTENVLLKFFYADSLNDFSSITEFHAQTITKGVDFPDDDWDILKVENIIVPSQAVNGVEIRMQINGDGATPGTLQYKTVGWQCNEGKKVLPWRLQRSDDIQELLILKRYAEKSYNLNVNPGTATEQNGIVINGLDTANKQAQIPYRYEVRKRVNPSITFFDFAGNSNRITTFNTVGTQTQNVVFDGTSGTGDAGGRISETTSQSGIGFHYLALAEL